MSKLAKDKKSSRRTQATSFRPPVFLASAAPTVSTSTSVGLSLAGLPATPSPILIGPGRDEGLGYFALQRHASVDSRGVGRERASDRGVTAEGHFISTTGGNNQSSSSSTSSSFGASGLLAALNDSIDRGDAPHGPPSPINVSPPERTTGVRFASGAGVLPSHDSVDNIASRGSVSSFADDVSSLASPVPQPSTLPGAVSRSSRGVEFTADKPQPKLKHAAVKRAQSGHGIGFVPSPAALSVASASSSRRSSVSMPRSRSTSDRLADVLANSGDTSFNLSRSSSLSAVPNSSGRAQSAPRRLAMGNTGATTTASVTRTVVMAVDTKGRRDDKIQAHSAANTSNTGPASSATSFMAPPTLGQKSTAIDERNEQHDPSRRSATPSPPHSSGSRCSGKYRTPSSSVDGDVFYTPPEGQAVSPSPSSTSGSHSRPHRYHHKHQKRTRQHWIPTGASDSDDDMQLNDVDENASGGASGSASLTSSTMNVFLDADHPHSKIPSMTNDHQLHYIPPYEPRKRGGLQTAASTATTSTAFSSTTLAGPTGASVDEPEETHPFAITLVASLGFQSADGLPFNLRRMELELLWNAAPTSSWWSYVPCSQYIPQWRLRPAGASSGYEEVGLMRWAVGKLPIVGGVASAWL